ncbi:hypothetical protein EPUL_003108 [Erysiphe pulchra]|uniref:Uncharacterized protein n=1 Tax=Erysiphe pulchra TaxID=225359 RepID=A0A2S4PSS0_9PEZI|nr:hypothetical protein EPUL_003108 [Erysiphe pulchra]
MSLICKGKSTRKVRYQSRISSSTSSASLSSRPRSKVCKVTKNLPFSTRQKRNSFSSVCLPLIKSHNLASLINRFENLDNVTTSTITGLSPFRSRELSRRPKKDQITNRCSDPDLEISNRVEETRGKDLGDVPNQYENTSVYSKSPKPQSKVNLDPDKKISQTQQSKSNFVDEEAVKKNFQGYRRRLNFTSEASTQIVFNDNNRVISMQEKIRFFDGSATAIESNKSGFCEITRAKSKLEDVQESRDINKKNNLETWQKQVIAQTSSINPSKTISERLSKQNSAFDPKTTNQLSTKRSPKNCSFSVSTEPAEIPYKSNGKTGLRSMYPKKNKNSSVCSADFDKLQKRDLEQDVGEDLQIKYGSLNTKLNMKSLSRKPSNKIEALFRQSMDQTHDTSENNQNHMNGSCLSPKIKLECHKREDQKNKMMTQKEINAEKEAKFFNTRQKFEIKILPEESIKKDNCLSDEQGTYALQPSKQDKKLSRVFIDRPPSYSSESLLKRYRNTKTELVSPEVVENFAVAETPLVTSGMRKKTGVTQENLQKKNSTSSSTLCRDKEVQNIPINTQGAVFSLPEKMAPVASSSLVGEKVKQFENIKSLRASGVFSTKRSITRRLNRSLREFFEYWGSHEKMREKNESSSIDELGDSCEEFQCFETKRKKSKGILKLNAASSKNPPKAKNIKEHSEKSSDSSSLDEMDVWIIKKVNCGLKQPKPLRAVEIKSMVLLCSSFGCGSKTNSIPI